MTVSSAQSYVEYSGDGATKAFTIPFYFLLNTDIGVMIADASGNVTDLVNGTNFSVTGQGDSSGGTVTLNTAYAAGNTILVYRNPPVTQETKYYENGKFPANSHEKALDKLTMLIQEYGWNFRALSLRRPNVYAKYYDAKGNRISNLGDPTADSDAVNKKYADSAVSGAVAGEAAIRAAADIAEATIRAIDDNNLSKRIDSEEKSRQGADANIQAQLTGNTPLEASAFSEISWHGQEIGNSVTIPDDKNAWSFGPQMEIKPGQAVTVGEGSTWTIANGRAVEDEDLHNLIADSITTSTGSRVLNVSDIATSSDVSTVSQGVAGNTDEISLLTQRVTTEEEKVNDIEHGGTGSTTAATARSALGAASSTGVTDGTDAATGQVGEYLSAQSTAAAITTATPANLAAISLTAGDWDIQGLSEFIGGTGCIPTLLRSEISVSSASFAGFGQGTLLNGSFGTATTNRQSTNTVRISLTATTTVYLVGQSNFSGGTMTARGLIRARRIR